MNYLKTKKAMELKELLEKVNTQNGTNYQLYNWGQPYYFINEMTSNGYNAIAKGNISQLINFTTNLLK